MKPDCPYCGTEKPSTHYVVMGLLAGMRIEVRTVCDGHLKGFEDKEIEIAWGPDTGVSILAYPDEVLVEAI